MTLRPWPRWVWVLFVLTGCGGSTAAQARDASPGDATGPDVTLEAAPDSTTAGDGPTSDVGADASFSDAGESGSGDGPGEASRIVLTADSGLTLDPSCSGMPPDSFGFEAGTERCFAVTVDAGADAEVCFPESVVYPGIVDLANSISSCTEGPIVGPCPFLNYASYSAQPQTKHGMFCCQFIEGPPPVVPPDCAPLGSFRYVAYGYPVDTDRDTVFDLIDNCPYAPNGFQQDVDKDGIGDVCDDCPYTFDPAQASMTDGGIGNACNCALAGVILGPNGCPCGDGGAGSAADAGDVCRLLVTADGGLTSLDGGPP